MKRVAVLLALTACGGSNTDEPGRLLVSASRMIAERGGWIDIIVERRGEPAGDVSVRYRTIEGTALAAADFSPRQATLVWGDGDGAPKSIAIDVMDDESSEAAETFVIELFEPQGAMLELAAAAEAQYALRIPGAPVDRVNIAITIVDDDTQIAREPEPQPPASNAPRPLDVVALPMITEVPGGVISDPVRMLERRVAASEDDAEENLGTKAVGITSDDLELVDLGMTRQRAGLRFANLAIPRGARITRAYVQFECDEANVAPASLTIAAEASDDAPAFAAIAENVSARARTMASVAWSPPPWATIGEAGVDQQTPDLSALVQSVVDRGGWTGGAIVLLLDGQGARVARSFDGLAASAPLLHVEFVAP